MIGTERTKEDPAIAISEYNAFGPWLYEIDGEHPVPRLFASHIPENEVPLFLFKVPRDIERRNARPDMDLYDYVAGAYSERILILKREDRRVVKTEVPYSRIEGLGIMRHLLKGALTLYLKDGEAELPFNTVSMDIIKRFAALIRGRMPKRSQGADPAEKQAEIKLNILFTNFLNDLRKDGETPLLYAYQPEAVLPPVCRRGKPGFLDRFRCEKIPAALHVLTPQELIIIQQEASKRRDTKGEFFYRYFYLPLSDIRQIEIQDGPEPCGLVISLSRHSFPFRFESKTPGMRLFYQTVSKCR